MHKSERVSLDDLERLAFKWGWTIERDPNTNLTYAIDDAGRERAFAITDTTVPGVSSR